MWSYDVFIKRVEGSLLQDPERVVHVAEMILRRALWLGQLTFINDYIRRGKTVEKHPEIQRFLLHDHVARASEETDTLPKGKPAWLHCIPVSDPSVLTEGADVLVAAAAAGCLEVFTSIKRWATESTLTMVPVDLARIIEVACLYGHVDIAAWLCDANNTHWIDEIRKKECMKIGLTRAAVALRQQKKEAVLSEMRKLPIVFEDDVARDEHLEHPRAPLLVGIANIGPMSSHEKQSAPTSMIEFTVLTNASIMATIGSFQITVCETVKGFRESCSLVTSGLECMDSRLGALPRMAIFRGDLALLKSVYIYARQRASATKPRYRFENAMHIAAGEGRLEILQWLHALPGTIHKCRPDTMALAARSGWADIVEWLHLNCPESGSTMSEPVINDVVRQGFVDVLRVCLQYGLGEFTARSIEVAAAADMLENLEKLPSVAASYKQDDDTDVIYRAIRCGRVQVVEALNIPSSTTEEQKTDGDHDELLIKCLQLQDPSSSSVSEVIVSRDLQAIDTIEHVTLARRSIAADELVDVAIKCGRVDPLRFLLKHSGQSLDHHHLALALLSMTSHQDQTIDHILMTAPSTSDLLRQCAIDHFAEVCDRGSPRSIQLLFAAVVSVAEAIGRRELPSHSLDQRSQIVVNSCAKALLGDSVEEINRYLSEGRRYVTRGLLHCGQLSPSVLEESLRAAVAAKNMKAVHARLAELSVGQWSNDTFGLLERCGLYESLPKHLGRTATDMVRLLRKARSLDVCRKLLAAEDKFYPRDVVMKNAPKCALRVVTRCLLDAESMDEMPCLNRAASAIDLRLGVDELLQLISRKNDDALLQFVIKHKRELIDPRLWMEACSHENLDVLVFLYREVSLVDTNYEELPGKEAVAVWALRNAMRTVASKTPTKPDEAEEGKEATAIRSKLHTDVVVSLFRQHSKEAQARVIALLIDAVCDPSTPVTNTSRFGRLVDIIGVEFVHEVASHRRQRVLELALDAKRFEAATTVLEMIGADGVAAADLKVLPLMAKAARHNHLPIVPKLYALKSESETIDVAGVRKAFGLRDASAAHTLLTELQQLDDAIRDQLEQERSLFGVVMTATTNASDQVRRKKAKAKGRPARR